MACHMSIYFKSIFLIFKLPIYNLVYNLSFIYIYKLFTLKKHPHKHTCLHCCNPKLDCKSFPSNLNKFPRSMVDDFIKVYISSTIVDIFSWLYTNTCWLDLIFSIALNILSWLFSMVFRWSSNFNAISIYIISN
jgi:hypothetical protein